MENVEIHHLTATGKECRPVFLLVDEGTDSSQYQSTREDCLDVSPGSLENDREDRRYH